MTVHGKPVETVSITEAVSKFMYFFKNLGNDFIAHNGSVFDFRVLSYAIRKVKMVNDAVKIT